MSSLEHPATEDNDYHSHHHQDTCQADRTCCGVYPQSADQPEGGPGQRAHSSTTGNRDWIQIALIMYILLSIFSRLELLSAEAPQPDPEEEEAFQCDGHDQSGRMVM